MKKIIITESQFNKLFILPQNLLTEGDSRINKVRNIIMPRCFHGLLDLDATVTSPEYQVHNNPNTTWGDYLLFNLRHTFGLMGNSDVPLVLYIAPIAWSDEVGFDKRNDNNDEIDELTKICQLFKQEPNLFIKAKNTCPDYEKLHQLCAPILQQMRDEANERMDNTNYTTNNQYTILKDIDYEKAHEIGNYSSMQDHSTCLCYTQSDNIWDSWTKGGKNTAFVCLKEGWKEMKPEPGPNAPYDEYGLSMIFVFVNQRGQLVASNTRWNHENAGGTNVDHAFTEEEISNIIGIRFKDAFKPTSNEEREKLIKQKHLAITQEFLDGVSSNDWFLTNNMYGNLSDRFVFVIFHGLYNIYDKDTGTITSPDRWFDDVWNIYEVENHEMLNKFIVTSVSDEYINLYTSQGVLIKKEIPIVSLGTNFVCGYTIVKLDDNNYNYMDTKGNILSPINFYECQTFNEKIKLATVQDENYKSNFITTEGNLLFDDWISYKRFIGKTFWVLGINGKYHIYDLLTKTDFFPEGFDGLNPYFNRGYFFVMNNNKFNIVDTSRNPKEPFKLISPNQWFDELYPDDSNLRAVEATINGQTQIINLDLL